MSPRDRCRHRCPRQTRTAGEPPPFRGSPDLALVWRHPAGLLLYRNRRLLPRAYLATTAVVAEDDAAAAQAVNREASRLGQVVVLSAGEELAVVEGA